MSDVIQVASQCPDSAYLESAMPEVRALDAARAYLSRNNKLPNGSGGIAYGKGPHGKRDSQGRWYPAEDERLMCCNAVRGPSREWPYSLLTHCSTMSHVARLYQVELRDVRAAVKRILS